VRILFPLFTFFGLALLMAGGCGVNGHLDPQPVTASVGDTAVNCNCNLTFDHSSCIGGTCRVHFPIELCLPPELNLATIDYGHAPTAAGMALMNLPQDQFQQRIQDYCQSTVTNIVYHLIQVWNGGWCDYKAPWAPAGGIGDSVACFPLALSSDSSSATEHKAGACEQPCPQVACSNEICGDGVQDSLGNIHLDRCQCNQVTEHFCPGDPPGALPTAVFCRP
jgi:hypothetical protein